MKALDTNMLVWVLVLAATIVPLTRVFGFLANRLGQPKVVGEIFSGVLLGVTLKSIFALQSGFTSSATYSTLLVMSQLGIVLLMSQLGMEFEFGVLKKNRRIRALVLIPAIGIAGAFTAGIFMGGWYMHVEGLPFSGPLLALCGILFSVTALPVLGRILVENHMQKTAVGVTTITVAAITDIFSWIMVGALMLFATNQAFQSLLFQVGMLGLIAVLLFKVIRPLFFYYVPAEKTSDWGIFAVISLVFLMAVAMECLGFCAVLGGFIAGVALHKHHEAHKQMDTRIMPFVNAVLVPIYFTVTGMRIDLGAFVSPSSLYWLLAFVLIASTSKILFSAVAAKLCNFSIFDSLKIGVLVNTKGLMELIVLNIAYDLGIIDGDLFSIMVLLAILTTVLTHPLTRVVDKCSKRFSGLTLNALTALEEKPVTNLSKTV